MPMAKARAGSFVRAAAAKAAAAHHVLRFRKASTPNNPSARARLSAVSNRAESHAEGLATTANGAQLANRRRRSLSRKWVTISETVPAARPTGRLARRIIPQRSPAPSRAPKALDNAGYRILR